MTEQRSRWRANRVHVPIEAAGPTGNPSIGRLLEAHPGVVRASLGVAAVCSSIWMPRSRPPPNPATYAIIRIANGSVDTT